MIAEKSFKRGEIVKVKTDTEPRFKYLVTTVDEQKAVIYQLGTGFSRVVPLTNLEPSQR